MSERRTVKDAREAVNRLFSDRSVSAATTRVDLTTLRDEIDLLIVTLPAA